MLAPQSRLVNARDRTVMVEQRRTLQGQPDRRLQQKRHYSSAESPAVPMSTLRRLSFMAVSMMLNRPPWWIGSPLIALIILYDKYDSPPRCRPRAPLRHRCLTSRYGECGSVWIVGKPQAIRLLPHCPSSSAQSAPHSLNRTSHSPCKNVLDQRSL
jgi:hypothetical protein